PARPSGPPAAARRPGRGASAAASSGPGRAPCRPGAARRGRGRARRGRARPPRPASPGSEVSRGGLLEDGLVQLRLGQQPLQPRVLLLQVLEAAGLVELQAAVLLAPAIVRGLGDGEVLADLGDGRTPGELDLGLAEPADDLLGRGTLLL